MNRKLLNPDLYESLERTFYDVKISKAGEKLITTPGMYRGRPSPTILD